MVFQVEEAVAVDGVISACGFQRGAVGEEVIGGEDAQGVGTFVIDPVHGVPGVGAVQAAQEDERALAFARQVAACAPVQGDLQEGGEHFFDE